MIKKIVPLLLFVIFFVTTAQIFDAFAGDSYKADALTIEELREKRGAGSLVAKDEVTENSLIKKIGAIISTQKVQFSINLLMIFIIIALIIFFKRKVRRVDIDEPDDGFNIKVDGDIDNIKKVKYIEKPALLEIIEKLLFPFFRRDIEYINTQLSRLSMQVDEHQERSKQLVDSYQADLLREIDLLKSEVNNQINQIRQFSQISQANSQAISQTISNINSQINKVIVAQESARLLSHRLFILGKNIQITKTLNCPSEDFIKSSEASLSVEREFDLFSHIPIEYFERTIKYKNIIALGNWANLLIKKLGFGISFKHSFLDAVEITTDGEKIIPISLLPEHINKIESMVITNPDLSSVLIYADNILERVKDNISESIIMPIELNVPPFEFEFIKFGDIERNDLGVYRWAIGFEEMSAIRVYSNLSSPKNVEVRFSIIAATTGSYVIFNDEKILIENNIEIVRNIELNVGENLLQFGFDGEKIKIGADPRELKFAIYNFTINGNFVMSDLSIATDDYNIRKRLHSVGFFEVEAEIVENKAFYVEQLPISYFSQLPPNFCNMKPSIAILRDFAKLFKTNSIKVLYKCFRKERLYEK